MPDAEIKVVSRMPRRAARDYGAKALSPGAGGVVALLRAAAQAELVLCGGGGLFQDDDSLVKMPYWALRLALVRLFAPRIVGFALGVGPLRAVSSRLAARLAFATMAEVSVRDPVAGSVAQPLTGKSVALLADPAFLLEPAPRQVARQRLASAGVPLDDRPLIGVAPRRWFPPAFRLIPHRFALRLGLPDPQRGEDGERLRDLLARLLDRQVQRHGAYIVFLPTYNIAHEGDDRVSAEILARMQRPEGRVVRINDPALYQAVTRELTALLGGRMHPVILAASVGTPVVSLAYNPKFRGLFELLSLPDQVHDVATFVREGRLDPVEASLEAAIAGRCASEDKLAMLGSRLRDFLDRQLGVVARPSQAYAA
jgi:polysaccharide pyruvyl transferase WcaK-like protein